MIAKIITQVTTIAAALFFVAGCTSTRSAQVHGTNSSQAQDLNFRSCPATIFVIDQSVKTPPFSESSEDLVLEIVNATLERQFAPLLRNETPADLELVVLKAYATQMGTSKSVVVVLKVKSKILENDVILRGKNVGMNWWGTQREFEKALRDSINTALIQLKQPMIDACESQVSDIN